MHKRKIGANELENKKMNTIPIYDKIWFIHCNKRILFIKNHIKKA